MSPQARIAPGRFYIVLCEDLQAATFLRRVLLECGAKRHNIRVRPYPDKRFQQSGGTGARSVDGYPVYSAGSQHVRENFPSELAVVRTQNRRRSTGLLVHVDADNRTVQERHDEIQDACRQGQVPVRTSEDPVALLVPRREIETWIHFLMGLSVNEHDSFPKLTDREADAHPAAEAFAKHVLDGTTPPGAPPSLVKGLAELRPIL